MLVLDTPRALDAAVALGHSRPSSHLIGLILTLHVAEAFLVQFCHFSVGRTHDVVVSAVEMEVVTILWDMELYGTRLSSFVRNKPNFGRLFRNCEIFTYNVRTELPLF